MDRLVIIIWLVNQEQWETAALFLNAF